MAHYAFLDQDGYVSEVIAGVDENELIEGETPETWYAKFRGQRCIRTSYNGTIRKNYAAVGFFYDFYLDAFIPPKPYDSWVLDDETCLWIAPIEHPNDGKFYRWNEEVMNWIEVENDKVS